MKNQNKQDEYERTFDLSGGEPQSKLVELDHILFQVEQFKRSLYMSTREIQLLNQLKQYLTEQNND